MRDSLNVDIDKIFSGNIIKENSEYIFSYKTQDKNQFISLTMPVREKNYIGINLFPIFEMHLPEGYLLSIIKKHFSKILKTDEFGLLKLTAKNIKTRITYEGVDAYLSDSLSLESLIYPKDENLFDELVNRFALRSSLSGVQPKVLATVEDKATLSLDEYIVKSWGDDYPHLALNEYYCMSVLKKAGVRVPRFYISDDNKLFIMKRFDIKEDRSYLGFEDMCVLQAKQRDDKYEGSYEAIAKSIKIFVSPRHRKNALRQLFKMVVINSMVKNGDGHLKNFGLVYDGYEDINIAPAYDVVCTTMYIKKDIPALSLLGSKKWWNKKLLFRFALESCELTNKDTNKLYDECVIAIKEVSLEVQKDMKSYSNQEKIFLEELLEIFSNENSV